MGGLVIMVLSDAWQVVTAGPLGPALMRLPASSLHETWWHQPGFTGREPRSGTSAAPNPEPYSPKLTGRVGPAGFSVLWRAQGSPQLKGLILGDWGGGTGWASSSCG